MTTPLATSHKWTASDIPDLTGKVAIVTGASSGLGFETAFQLAAHGADVTLAVRSTTKGTIVASKIHAVHPHAKVTVTKLDLTDLTSIRMFATAFVKAHKRLDILINNAGIMAVPKRELTADGFESQFGTNHLGHFALTGLLLPLISKTPNARVVNVSSNLHKNGHMNFDDLHGQARYKPWAAYAQSKLANLLFTSELQRRFVEGKVNAIAVAAHPGWSNTTLMTSGPMKGRGGFMRWFGQAVNNRMAQPVMMGALNQLYAATASDVTGNDYFGPDGKKEQSGYPQKTDRTDKAKSAADAKRLWDVSEKLTGVRYL